MMTKIWWLGLLLTSPALAQGLPVTPTPTQTDINRISQAKGYYDAIALQCGNSIVQFLNTQTVYISNLADALAKSSNTALQKCNRANGVNISGPILSNNPKQYSFNILHQQGKHIFTFNQAGLVTTN